VFVPGAIFHKKRFLLSFSQAVFLSSVHEDKFLTETS